MIHEKPISWVMKEELALVLPNVKSVQDPVGRTWIINYLGEAPELYFFDDGKIEMLSFHHDGFSIVSPEGEVLKSQDFRVH